MCLAVFLVISANNTHLSRRGIGGSHSENENDPANITITCELVVVKNQHFQLSEISQLHRDRACKHKRTTLSKNENATNGCQKATRLRVGRIDLQEAARLTMYTLFCKRTGHTSWELSASYRNSCLFSNQTTGEKLLNLTQAVLCYTHAWVTRRCGRRG